MDMLMHLALSVANAGGGAGAAAIQKWMAKRRLERSQIQIGSGGSRGARGCGEIAVIKIIM